MLSKINLRFLTTDDAQNIFRLTSNENVARYMRFPTHTKIEETAELLEKYLEKISFAIEIGNDFAGVFSMTPENGNEYSLSIYFDEPYWNKGYATEILLDRIEYAKNILQASSLSSYIIAPNTGSHQLMKKCEFDLVETKQISNFSDKLYVYRKILK